MNGNKKTALTNEEFAALLERLANIYRQNPGIPQLYTLTESTEFVFCHDKDTFARTVKAFGPGTKSADTDSLIFTPEACPTIRVNGFRHAICERVQIGTRVVPERVIEARNAEIIPEHEEPVYEWKCAPFLQEEVKS